MDTVIDKNYEKLLDKNYLTLARNKKIWDLDLPSYLHIVCKTASQSMNTARVSVNIFDDDNQSIRQIAQYVDSSQEENVGKEVLEKKDYPNYFKTYNTARVIDVADTNSDPRTIEFLKHFVSLGIRAVLDVSIHKAGELRGFVWVEHVGGTRVWSEPEKRFLISIGDLVSQRMLDEKLKEETTYFSELSAFHEAIINSSRDSIISVDLDGKIQTINQSAINLLEYSQTDLIDQDLCSFLLTTENNSASIPIKTGNSKSPSALNFDWFKKQIDKNKIQYFECQLISQSGVKTPVNLNMSKLIDTNGQLNGYLCTASDISSHIESLAALSEQDEKYRFIFENSSDALFLIHEGICIECNQACLELFGTTRNEFIGSIPVNASPEIQPDGQNSLKKSIALIEKTVLGETQHYEWVSRRMDNGENFNTDITLSRIELNNKIMFLISARDITARKQTENELLNSRNQILEHSQNLALINELSQQLHGLDNVDDIYSTALATLNKTKSSPGIAIYTMDRDANQMIFKTHYNFVDDTGKNFPTIAINPKFNELALKTQKVVYIADLESNDRLSPKHTAALIDNEAKSLAVLPLVHKDTEFAVLLLAYKVTDPFNQENLRTLNSIAKTVSIALSNATINEELDYIAHHDSLTSLGNRAYFHKGFKQKLEKNHSDALLFLLDLDHFKEINDSLGHFAGDRILQQVGNRINNLLGDETIVCRLGGDEFIVLVYGTKTRDEAAKIANDIIECIRKPFPINDLSLEVGTSVGIAMYPNDGKDSHALLRSSDVAMYQAKKSRAGFAFYNSDIDIHTPERLTMMAEIGSSITSGQLFLHYQPKMDLKTHEILGFEALVRWKHPRLGLISPAVFIPLIEMTNSIHKLTEEVLHQALAQQQKWRQDGLKYTVAVNLSARNLVDDSIVKLVSRLLDKYDTPPDMLELEITESALMQDPVRAIEYLKQLADIGVKLSIDDFGTGYSSLSYLRNFPIHKLKLDRQFIMDMLDNKQGSSIVESIISLSNNLDLDVIAEGVEDKETLDQLTFMNCDQAQGYYICKPNTWDSIQQWLTSDTLKILNPDD